MLKKISALLAIAVLVLQGAGLPDVYVQGQKLEGIFPRPKVLFPDGPRVLIMAGGRPWVGCDFGAPFAKAGANLQLLNSVYLAGEGGSFIRILPQEGPEKEPTPVDAITYEFQDLSPYRLIVVAGIPRRNQQNIFTPERIEKLRSYVKNGGNLLVTLQIPPELDDLLPVHLGTECNTPENTTLFVQRPAGQNFTLLPQKWGLFDPYREITAKPGTEVLNWIEDAAGRHIAPYAVRQTYGKGSVLFLNCDFVRRQTNRQMFTWAYSKVLYVAMANAAAGLSLNPAAALPAPRDVEPPKIHEETTVTVSQPAWGLLEDAGEITVSEKTLLFPNGFRLVFQPSKRTMNLYRPGEDRPVLTDISAPLLRFSTKQPEVESDTAEAVGTVDTTAPVKIRWRLRNLTGGKIARAIWTSADGDELEMEFKCGKAVVDGVEYSGIAQRLNIRKSNRNLASIITRMKLQSQPGKIRRLACYQLPRGYNEYAPDTAQGLDTRTWGFFADGQPFTWLEQPDYVYAGFVEKPFSVSAQFFKTPGEDSSLMHIFQYNLGYRQAPIETEFYWHTFAPAKLAANNQGWLSLYQFLRHHLRTVAGFPEIPGRPLANYSNTDTEEQKRDTIRKMGKAGFSFCLMPWCPSEMKDFDDPSRAADFALVRQAGMKAYPWTPCGHSVGVIPDAKNLSQWFAHQADGTVYTYFGGHYPVVDLANPDFLEWYLPRMKQQIDAGVGTWWFDMGGSASGTINFARPNSGIGLTPQIKMYKQFYDWGVCVVTEGMNPLTIDGYIYRPSTYTPMKGREYAFHGGMLPDDSGGHSLDYFRTSMFGTFFNMCFDNFNTGFDSLPNEQKDLEEIVHYLPAITRALDTVGMPFIRMTEFGTSWVSPKGAALFFYDGTKKLKAVLPPGFQAVAMVTPREKMVELNGKLPSSVPPKTILVFEKKP